MECANRDEALVVLEKARDAMSDGPNAERVMVLLRKAERMHASDEVRKAIVDWQAICDVFTHKGDVLALLGATLQSSESELNAARKKLSLKVHPDKNSAPHAAEAFQIVQVRHAPARTARRPRPPLKQMPGAANSCSAGGARCERPGRRTARARLAARAAPELTCCALTTSRMPWSGRYLCAAFNLSTA
jgi:DnaJ family protein B protein 12